MAILHAWYIEVCMCVHDIYSCKKDTFAFLEEKNSCAVKKKKDFMCFHITISILLLLRFYFSRNYSKDIDDPNNHVYVKTCKKE